MIFKTPTHYFMAFGAAEGFTPLNAFDGALLCAGIGDLNLIKMSSIVPPHCLLTAPARLPLGSLTPMAYASMISEKPGEMIASAVAVAMPKDPNLPGLIMEYSGRGTKIEIEGMVWHMVLEGIKQRKREIIDIKIAAVEHTVRRIGATVAAVVLYDLEEGL
jgi:arginine decarboxylase